MIEKTDSTVSERAFTKRLNTFLDKFKSDAEAGREFKHPRGFIGQMRRLERPASPAIVEAMGFEVEIIRPPIRRVYRKKM